jgi:hypothetical protein
MNSRLGRPRCGGGLRGTGGRTTTCVGGVGVTGFPHRSVSYRRAGGTGEDVASSSSTNKLWMHGWTDSPISDRPSGSTSPHSDWRLTTGSRLADSRGLSGGRGTLSPGIASDLASLSLRQEASIVLAISSTTGTREQVTADRPATVPNSDQPINNGCKVIGKRRS